MQLSNELLILGGWQNFEQKKFKMAEISNYTINERYNIASHILRESPK